MRTVGKPLIALAALASSYKEWPKHCATFNKQKVYGWPKNSERNERLQVTYSLILGAKQQKDKGNFIFFVECRFVRLHESSTVIIELEPKKPTEGYFIVTHKTLNAHLKNVFVPLSEFSTSLEDKSGTWLTSSFSLAMPALSDSQKAYVKKLRAFGPTSAILENPIAMAKCNALGQEIFDKYKSEEGSSLKGFYAAQSLCDALAFNPEGVKTREWLDFKEAVTRIWAGIGDSTKWWIP
jgi:hypothetical protein